MGLSGTGSDHDEGSDTGQQVTTRLRVLRDDHPDATVSTDLTRLDENQAVVRAEIVLAGGGSASAYGVAVASLTHAVEEAENRALSRALSALGYIEVEHQATEQQRQITLTAVEPEPVFPDDSSPDEVDDEPALAEPSAPVSQREGSYDTTTDDADPPLEDYSWTAFWKWARNLGYENKVAVEEIIGEPITSLSPAQVRNALRAKAGVD